MGVDLPFEENQLLAGTYRIIRLIGEGGMGAVYEAKHTRLPRRFAVKVLFPHVAAHSEAVDRFKQEAMITSELGHPHIVDVVDFNFTSEGQAYLVMEYLEGENLEERLEQEKRLPLKKVEAILTQTASALDAAHKRGIIHRDLKPQNLFLCNNGQQEEDYLKVLDFGISKVRGSNAVHTRTHIVIGTPWYMSPEQARGRASSVDHRTDMFAMGTMLYEMLSGTPPFMGETPDAVLYQVVHEEPEALSGLRDDVTWTLQEVVRKAMAKKPEDRYDTMSELAREFTKAIDPWEKAIAKGLEDVQTTPGVEMDEPEEEATIPEIDLAGMNQAAESLDSGTEDEEFDAYATIKDDSGFRAQEEIRKELAKRAAARDNGSGLLAQPTVQDDSGLFAQPPPQDNSGLHAQPPPQDNSGLHAQPPPQDNSGPHTQPPPQDNSGLYQYPPAVMVDLNASLGSDAGLGGGVAPVSYGGDAASSPGQAVPSPTAAMPQVRKTTLSTSAGEDIRRRQSFLPVALGAGFAAVLLGVVLYVVLRGEFEEATPLETITINAPPSAVPRERPAEKAPPTEVVKPAPRPHRRPHRKRRRPERLRKTLNAAQIKESITAIKGKVQACANRYRVPGLAPVEFQIRPDGTPGKVKVQGFLASTPTARCIEAAARTVRFPPFRGPAFARTYPFMLTPSANARPLARLNKKHIRDGMHGASGWVRMCLKRHKVKEQVMVQVTIATTGQVSRARIKGKRAGTPSGHCIQRAVRQARFPVFRGAPLTITYPYLP